MAIFVGAYGYFRIERNVWLAVGAAAVIAVATGRLMLRDTDETQDERPLRTRRFGIEVVLGGAGLGLLLAGAVDGSSSLALAGLLLAALAGAWWLIKRDIRRRGSRGES